MKNNLKIWPLVATIVIVLNTNAQTHFILSAKSDNLFSTVQTTAGKWNFSVYQNNIIKATFTANGIDRNEQVSDAVITKPMTQSATIKYDKNSANIYWRNDLSINMDSSNIKFIMGKNITISMVKTFYTNEYRGFNFSLKPGEMIFGAGERSIPLNRRGYKLPLNNAPAYGYSLNAESLNYSVPYILSSEQYAIFFDNPSKGFMDIGKTDPGIFEYRVTSGELTFYLIPGKNYASIMESYQSLVGTQPLPPRWAMGSFMSRFGYRNEKETKALITQMKKDSIPFDAVIFDLFWFGDSIKNTLGNLTWVNKTAWPDPQKMISDFEAQHLKTILITEPFVLNTSLNYEQSKTFHATDSAGNPYVLQQFYFGKGGIIDIFRKDAQQWFYKKYKAQMNIGVTGWWGDLGEPENHPANVYHDLKDFGFKRKFASGEIHNIYGHYWSKMLYENFKKDYPNKRLFHLNRSGYAGTPRFSSFPWSGDVSRSWDGLKAQVPLMLGMSMSGIPYIHSDAGGFAGGEGDPALYVRWLQFAAFTPVFRPHGAVLGELDPNAKYIPSEISLWPEPTKSLAREAANTRYKWLPYNYTLSYEQTKYGKPLVLPMFYFNSKDSNLYKATEQYMWGENVMIVPITDKGQSIKTFYVPQGTWTNLNTSKEIKGPLWVTDSSITMNGIPVFAKAGSFIPMMPGMQNTTEYSSKTLNILYLPADQPSEYRLYEDDGMNPNALRNKKYELTRFSSSGMGETVSISISCDGGSYPGQVAYRNMILIIPNIARQPKEIKINGKTVNLTENWNEESKTLHIPFIFQHKKTALFIRFN